MLNFVLCDDNLNIVKKLKDMLEILFLRKNLDAEIKLLTDNPNEVLDYESENHVDVLILDINLNTSISGIDLAKKIRKKNKNVYVIFLTGHLEYSLIAYSVKTFDYLPKPITLERLEITLDRLLEDLNDNNYSNKSFIKINNKAIINEKEVNYIKRDGMKLVFCTNSGEFETYSSFNKISDSLPDNFIRCHKSYIANTENIINTTNNEIIFNNNISCDIGPKYKNNLMEVLKNGNFTNNLGSINNRK